MLKKIIDFTDKLACKILARYFLLLKVPDSFQKIASHCDKTIVITQSSSIIIRGVLKSFAQRREIPTLTHLKDFFQNNTEISPTSPYTLYWESLSEQESIEKIRSCFQNFSISTFHIFAGRGPIYANPSYHIKWPTLLKILIAPLMGLFGQHYFIFSFGEPFPVQTPKISNKTKLARRIKVDIFQNTKLVRGVAFQTLDVQAHYLLEGHETQRMVRLLSKKLNKSEKQIRKDLIKEFYRMAANPDGGHMSITGALANIIIKRFPQVLTLGLDRYKQKTKENAVVLVPMHRSHFDYIILNGILYDSNLKIPLIASGMNLRFWPVGNLLSKTGAFYIRRESKPNLIHNFLLQRYITYLINRGHLQEFFIEGGRSRSGRMLPPKLGLLGIMVNAFLKKVRHEVLFMPVSISYEHFAEAAEYARENSGLPKKSENCVGLLKAVHHFLFRSQHNGEVIINFGEPLSIADFSKNLAKEDTNGEAFKKKLVSGLGTTIMDRITEQTAPCLSYLSYTALMMAPNYGMKKQDLVDTIIRLAHICKILRHINPNLGDFSPTLEKFLKDPEHDLTELTLDGHIKIIDDIFYIEGNQRYCANYYKNSAFHLFYTISLLSILDLQKIPITSDNAVSLNNKLGERVLILRQPDFASEVELIIKALQKDGILSTPNNSSEAVYFKKKDLGYYTPAFLLPLFESLAWVFSELLEQKQNSNIEENINSEQDSAIDSHGTLYTFARDEFIKKAQTKMLLTKYTGPRFRTESSAKSALNQAIDACKEIGIVSTDAFSQGKTLGLLRLPKNELTELTTIINLIKRDFFSE